MKRVLLLALCACLLVTEALLANSVVRFSSNVGDIDMELFDTETPLTVTNFLSYVNAGRYNQSFIHRSVPGFVIQGGGFGLNGTTVLPVPTNAAVPNEPGISNLRGTVAMAKLGSSPDSATSQWFINLKDNSQNLDAQNGGFTVFGRVVGNGMAVADRIAAFPTYDATAYLGGAFGELPLQNAALTVNNLILFSTVRALPALEAWKTTYFGANSSNASISALTADPDADGYSNAYEFAFGGNPAVSGLIPTTSAISNGNFRFSFQKRKNSSDVTYEVRMLSDLSLDFASGNLISTQTSSPQPSGIGGDYEQVEAVIPTSTQKGFMRVKATVP
jgi:cyclophilin family peptidyl-prolyl cis-trans isomerase